MDFKKHHDSESLVRWPYTSILMWLLMWTAPAHGAKLCLQSLSQSAIRAYNQENSEHLTGIYKFDIIRVGEKTEIDGPDVKRRITQLIAQAFIQNQGIDELGVTVTGSDFSSGRVAILHYLLRIQETEESDAFPSMNTQWTTHSDSPYKLLRWIPVIGIAGGLSAITSASITESEAGPINAAIAMMVGVCAIGIKCAFNYSRWRTKLQSHEDIWTAFLKDAEDRFFARLDHETGA